MGLMGRTGLPGFCAASPGVGGWGVVNCGGGGGWLELELEAVESCAVVIWIVRGALVVVVLSPGESLS